jgi:hypothetical protein
MSMVGRVLYPLNELARVAPDAADRQRAKYLGRDAVLHAEITPDGLRFNDTIHCGPIHPHHLYRARRDLDLLPKNSGAHWQTGAFFEIPLGRITPHPVYWYHWVTPWINGYPGEAVPSAPPLKEFEPFEPARYVELSEPPEAHLAYLRQMKQEDKPALMFVHIPHVLVAGPINTTGLRTISWEETS